MAKSKRIIDIETRLLPKGGASCSSRQHYDVPKSAATTAVAKAMFALNEYCERQKLGIVLVPHDPKTNQRLQVTMAD